MILCTFVTRCQKGSCCGQDLCDSSVGYVLVFVPWSGVESLQGGEIDASLTSSASFCTCSASFCTCLRALCIYNRFVECHTHNHCTACAKHINEYVYMCNEYYKPS